MAILIKRYANRKLYNTDTSRYITLKGIAALLDLGDEVRVVDNEQAKTSRRSLCPRFWSTTSAQTKTPRTHSSPRSSLAVGTRSTAQFARASMRQAMALAISRIAFVSSSVRGIRIRVAALDSDGTNGTRAKRTRDGDNRNQAAKEARERCCRAISNESCANPSRM
ncbi:MAG: hypothetical protein H8E78_02055 [Proteobacteria bacterium]|nr:hypothetical protein [Pseudomonadota bacterium]